MSLRLAPALSAVRPGMTIPFWGFDGTQPYVFSVLPGGAGGNIDPAQGVYLAPTERVGLVDTIQVEDADGNTATASVKVCTPHELVCDILQTELQLADGKVYLWDQKINSPTNQDLFIAVGIISSKAFGNSRKTENDVYGDFVEVQSINVQDTLSIDIISRGPVARDRKEEILLALKSTYAEQLQEQNSFFIAPLSTSFVNISQIDGAAIPYRFNISVALQYSIKKTKQISYYDSFEDPMLVTNS